MSKREAIKFTRVDIMDALKNVEEDSNAGELIYPADMKIVNIRGTNGSGKSTIPLQMLANDKKTYVLTLEGKDIATVFPSFDFVALGSYKNKCGGLDTIKTTDQMKHILSLVSSLPYSIILEGILASTVYSTYADLLNMYQEKSPKRKAVVVNIIPPFEIIKERVLNRNGGKEVKWEQVESKLRTVKKNAVKFREEAGLISLEVDNSNINIEDTLDWFFGLLDEI